MTMKNDTKIDEELTGRFKIHTSFIYFDPSTGKRLKKMFVLIDSLWPKYALFELQKYREVIFHNTEELCKFWRRTNKWFEKRHSKYGKFLPEHLKLLELELWWDPFVQSRKGMTLKFTEELCVMAMKNNAKFEGELTFHFKTDMRNLTNFDWSTRKFKKVAL